MRYRRRHLAALLLLTGCTQFPELDARVDPSVYDRDFPTIVPLEPLLAGPVQQVTPQLEQNVLARVSNLKARAARLSGPVVDARTKRRMARGVGL